MLGTLQVAYTDAAVAWMAGLSRPHRSDTLYPPREPAGAKHGVHHSLRETRCGSVGEKVGLCVALVTELVSQDAGPIDFDRRDPHGVVAVSD